MTRAFSLQWFAQRFTGARSSLASRQVLALRDASGTSYEIFTQIEFGKCLLAAGIVL